MKTIIYVAGILLLSMSVYARTSQSNVQKTDTSDAYCTISKFTPIDPPIPKPTYPPKS